MKKLVLMFAAAAMAVSASAQTTTESKFLDNWYLGVNVGAATKTTHNAWFNCVNPSVGVRLGKWFTPVYGVAVEADAYARNRHIPGYKKTLVRGASGKLMGTLNVSNLFWGYKGEPRSFEVIPVAGIGAYHSFNNSKYGNVNALTANAGIDFAFNLGSKKAWQVYVEPSMNWFLHDNQGACDGCQFDINKSGFQLKVGVNYKFKNSNGSHNFTIAQLRDQNEIDGLNNQINSLRNDLNGKDAEINAKDKQIQDLQNALNECNKAPKTNAVAATATNLQPTVLFRVGKSTIDRSQMANIEMIAQYMKNHPEATIEIKGYASPEGSKEINQKLSEARANAVKNVLVKTYKIKSGRLITKGMGATDKLFKQVEFNRVATFNDNNAE